jgi:hypothetical protein
VFALMVWPLGDDIPRDKDGAAVHSSAHTYVSGVLSDCASVVAFRQYPRAHRDELLPYGHVWQR